MYYTRGMANLADTIHEVSADPRRPLVSAPPGEEYLVPIPVTGPWYWQWPYGGNPYLDPDKAYYNPYTYPMPVSTGNLLPRWSGAYIQPRNLDPLAFELMQGGGLNQFVYPELEDPTGGHFWDAPGEEVMGKGFMVGDSIATELQWATQLKPRGFAATTV